MNRCRVAVLRAQFYGILELQATATSFILDGNVERLSDDSSNLFEPFNRDDNYNQRHTEWGIFVFDLHICAGLSSIKYNITTLCYFA